MPKSYVNLILLKNVYDLRLRYLHYPVYIGALYDTVLKFTMQIQ
jgi:hypothetical protein